MPCYHPITAYRNDAGVKFYLTSDSQHIQLPCGRCIGCRLERSRQWAVRLMHENRFHDCSSFITLTYSDDHLPKNGSLNVKHFQDFMKRLRKDVGSRKVRFFHAGEYGDKFLRPHYHAIIFGLDFMYGRCDVQTDSRTGCETWSSPQLDRLWPFGMNRVGSVTFESCAYVARYICKKVNGPQAKDHYQRICETTGEIFEVTPEYCTMSRRPGIGALHFDKYSNEIYLRDEVISRGYPAKPPKFYDKLLERMNKAVYNEVKDRRECALAMAPKKERTPSRLSVRETVKLAQTGLFSRCYEKS